MESGRKVKRRSKKQHEHQLLHRLGAKREDAVQSKKKKQRAACKQQKHV